MKIIITERQYKRILREEINRSDKYYRFLDKISSIIEKPYFRNMYERYNGGFWDITDEDDQEYILKNIYGDDINIKDRSIYDDVGNTIYEERSDGFWVKYEYDDNGKMIYQEHSSGYWGKYEYDGNGNTLYYEYSNGYWEKREYDDKGNRIYYEDSFGVIKVNR